MAERLVIPARFNGPRESGNGGYVAGAIAAFLDGAAAVSLRNPVPLDTPLAVETDGHAARVLDGDVLIAEAETTAELDLAVPEPIAVEEAREARSRYRGVRGGQFSRCFVCGLDRDDGFGVCAGEVADHGMVATPWRPPAWAAGPDGGVLPELVWAALDCPTYFASYLRAELAVAFLVRMAARIDAAVAVEEEHVVVGWPIEVAGSKRLAGSAILDAEGGTLAVGEVLLVEPRS